MLERSSPTRVPQEIRRPIREEIRYGMNTHVGRLPGRFERPGIIAADRRSGTDPGHEPALDGFGDGGDVDRRGVSLRWLGASVLTALTGAALIGGAIYVALQGETTFAELPEHVTAPGAAGSGRGQGHGGPKRRQARALGGRRGRKAGFRRR
jgi:hypothetical protein